MEVLSFDRYQIVLPKGDLRKEWEKLKKYMDIKLEDYEYKEPETTETKKSEESIETAQCPRCMTTAKNAEEVERIFGFRNYNGKQIVQSWCGDCRKTAKHVN